MLQILVVKARSLRAAWPRVLTVLLGAGLGAGIALYRGEMPQKSELVANPARGSELAHGAGAARVAEGDADRDCFERRAAASRQPQRPLLAINQPELRA